MERLLPCLATLALACEATPPPDAGVADAGAIDGSAAPDAGALDAAPSDAAVDAASAVLDAGPPAPCTWDDAHPPPAGTVLWPDVLGATGADTLRGHGHDDGRGPVGFCAGTPVAGEPFYRLVAVGFETDEDIDGDGDVSDALPVDFWRDPSASAIGESGGRVNVYVEVVDEAGVVLNRFTAPDTRYVRELRDGPVEAFALTDKPANEFQTNFPMVGGQTAAVSMEGASDRVFNLRLPVNHHVTFAVVFRREAP